MYDWRDSLVRWNILRTLWHYPCLWSQVEVNMRRKKKPRQREEIVLHDRQTLSLIKNDRSDLCQAVCSVLTFVLITTNEYSFTIDICLKYQTWLFSVS